MVLGAYADRKGRVACMTLAVALMTLAGAVVALLPGRAAIGMLAPFGVLAARLVQGFALGGEFGSATALMIEHSAGSETRAASWQGTSQNIASVLASGVAWLLSRQPTVPFLHVSGFRVAFALGVLAGPMALLLSPAACRIARFRGGAAGEPPGGSTRPAHLERCCDRGGTGCDRNRADLPHHLSSDLCPDPAAPARGLGARWVFVLYVAIVALTPLRLHIAARFDGSRRMAAMLVSCLAMLATAYPTFVVLGLWPNAAMLFALPLALTLVGLPYNAPLAGVMGLVFRVQHRGIGLSVGYSLGIVLFGGTAPFINTWLIALTGNPRSPALYLVFTASVTALAILLARRRLPRAALRAG